MIYTITITISILVALNFVLLLFSCNKVKKPKRKKIRKPYVVKSKPITASTPQGPNHLSPTGS